MGITCKPMGTLQKMIVKMENEKQKEMRNKKKGAAEAKKK